MRILIAAAFATLSLAVPYVAAQEKTDFKIPRTADGKPDFNGVWSSGGAERLGDLGGGPPRFTSAPNLPRAEPLSYQPWAEAERQKYLARRGIDDPIGRCMMPGVPRTTGMPMPIQFVQTPKQFIILYEAYHAYRIIPFDAKHPDDVEPSFMGDSVAHWEGDTLVVDVVGFNTVTWISGVGTIHTDKLHVVERYRFVDAQTRGAGSDDRGSRSAHQAGEAVLHAAARTGRADSRIRVHREQRGLDPVRTDPQDRPALPAEVGLDVGLATDFRLPGGHSTGL